MMADGNQTQPSREEIELQQLSESSAELESLTRSAAWGMVIAFIEDQTVRRMNEIMTTPIYNNEEIAKQNFARGECSGLQIVKKFVEDKLAVTKDAVELYRQAVSERGE